MSASPTYILYSNPHCHLCEQALHLLEQEPELSPQALFVKKIEGDAELERAYGVRIPVLRHVVSGCELGWPFDAASLRRFIRAQP